MNPAQYPHEEFDLFSVPAFPFGIPERVQGADVGSSKKTVAPKIVLFCKINPRINRVWTVPDSNGRRQVASTEWIQYAPSEQVHPEYLKYFLSQHSIRDFAAANVSGVGGSLTRAQPNVLDRVEMPLTTLDEQRQIVEAIETQFARLDDAVASLKRARTRLKRYRASVLKAACEGRLVPTEAELARQEGRSYEPASVLLERIVAKREAASGTKRGKAKSTVPVNTSQLTKLPEGWAWTTLNDISAIQGGIQKQPKRVPRANAYPFLRVANVLRGKLDLVDMHQIELFGDEPARLRLVPGDLLIVEGNGSPNQIGRMAVWDGSICHCVHQNHIIRARAYPPILPEYIECYWNSETGKQLVTSVAASTSGLYTLSVSKVSKINVPLPPVDEEERIVAEVERRMSVIEQMETTVETNLKRCESLRQSVLRMAFSGRLA